ncbi:MAG TPA: zinc ribbon domain-containing protein [Isosphaeraceae bacterium]|jgi:hypothetical protein|nr:zinc ribbon domain-containing protein [Isosphaeraceae bacterium]
MATASGREPSTTATVPSTTAARPSPPAPIAARCPRCSGPVDADDAFCPSCGNPLQSAAGPELAKGAPSPSAGFRCESCGAEVRCEPGSRSTTCPFCAAPYVVDFDPAASGRQEPEFVLGFAIPADRAEKIYREWLATNGLFRPSDLRQRAEAENLRGIYLPFWSFSARADSRWSAEVGEYWYRTETYTTTDAQGKTVTQTRQVQETEWWGLDGGHHAYHSFYLVSGSKGLPQAVSEWIQPFQLLALKRYAPHYLAGWLSEEYSVAKDQALDLSRAEFHRREAAAIAAFLPGDTHRGLRVETTFSKVNSDLILLPIYLRSYRYKGKLYRILINGQTGLIAGEKPISAARVAIAVVLALLLIAILVGLIVWGAQR